MCLSSLVLSRRPNILKEKTRPRTLKNPLTPIGSCRDLGIPPLTPDQPPFKAAIYVYPTMCADSLAR